MKRTFNHKDREYLTWTIEIDDRILTTADHTNVGSVKIFASAANCQKAADALIAEKIKEEYVEQGEGEQTPATPLKTLSGAAAAALADKLERGMRKSYYSEDSKKAAQSLQDAITELKTVKFKPEDSSKFADWYLEMLKQTRSLDLVEVLHNITLDFPAWERVLPPTMAEAKTDYQHGDIIRQKLAKIAVKLEPQGKILPLVLAHYFAFGKGSDEEMMYKYMQVALKNGCPPPDFAGWDFENHYQDDKYKALMRGESLEKAVSREQLWKELIALRGMPGTPEQAVAYISKLRELADSTDPSRIDEDNVMITAFYDPYGDEEKPNNHSAPAEIRWFVYINVIERFGEKLPTQSLVDWFVVSFYKMTANYQISLDVVDEINRRKDTEAQKQIADAFKKAGINYKAGHRAKENNVQNQLIDSYFPNFTDDGLIYLLETCNTQYLAADGMAQLFVALLQRNPSDEIKQRAYKCFADFYAKEGVTDDYSEQFVELFGKLAPLLPEDALYEAEEVNPDMWKDIESAIERAKKKPKEKTVSVRTAFEKTYSALDQKAIGAGIGSIGTLITHECDYTLYFEVSSDGISLKAFYPATRRFAGRYVSSMEATKSVIKKEIKGIEDLKKWDRLKRGAYEVSAGGERIDVTQQADRIKILGDNYDVAIGGWDSKGNLILAERDPFEGSVSLSSFRYVGYVKDGKMVFDENCGLK